MSNMGKQRHERLMRYLSDASSPELYHSAILLGPNGSTEVMALSYLALYAEGDMPYAQLLPPEALPLRSAQRQSLQLTFPPSKLGRRTPRLRSPEEAEAEGDVDKVLWTVSTQQMQKHGLPVMFMLWMRTISDQHDQISFWYSNRMPGSWALPQFQQRVRRSLAR